MKLEPFLLERWQSLWEHEVEVNLSESGVLPLTVRELLASAPEAAVLDQPLAYVQTNGSEGLRAAVAALHPAAGTEDVLVTTGCAEANHLALWHLLEPGSEVVMTVPNYMQTWGLARAFGATVKPWRLAADAAAGRWRGDLDELEGLVGERTRLVLLCHPNNPTGSCLDEGELDRIAAIAGRHGAWVLSDEVYRGAELRGGEPGPTFWGRGERVIVTGGLSKAYGLPGLRIGWAVAPAAVVEALWSRHDYTTIAPAALSDRLARIALEPRRRLELLERTRSILAANLGLVGGFLDGLAGEVEWITPQAGAMLYLAYRREIGSSELAERLRRDKGVLVVPGDHYGMDGHLRIGYGGRPEELRRGLERLGELFAELG